MYKLMLAVCLFVSFASCKKEHSKPVKKTVNTTTLKSVPIVKTYFYPEVAGTKINGEVQLNGDKITVATTYTNEVDNIEKGSDVDGNIFIHNYRKVVVHLINQHTKDTLSFTKELFKKEIEPEYNKVYLSNVYINQGKLNVDICPPDSDDCYSFWVGINKKGITKRLFTQHEYDEQ